MHKLIFIAAFFGVSLSFSASGQPTKTAIDEVKLIRVSGLDCKQPGTDCSHTNIIVFVHGIYGGLETFKNRDFDWPASLSISGSASVYKLTYPTRRINWSNGNNVLFTDLADRMMEAMRPLIQSKPLSIGFIAHSLGGNLVTTYLVSTKLRYGHAIKALHAYVITLDTPFLGAQIAGLASKIKSALKMTNDDLLKSLELNNLYLEMLVLMRRYETAKGDEFECRPTNLYILYSKKTMYGIRIVDTESWKNATTLLPYQNAKFNQPIGYDLDHSEISKPTGPSSTIYQDVDSIVAFEMQRVINWEISHDPNGLLCDPEKLKRGYDFKIP